MTLPDIESPTLRQQWLARKYATLWRLKVVQNKKTINLLI